MTADVGSPPATEADGTPPRGGGVLRRHARMLRSARALGVELLVVALGVLIALWAQQWAEGRSWREKTRAAIDALHMETADHYLAAVEWRTVEPCILAQIDRLQQRLLESGARLKPAPVYTEPSSGSYVIRMPSRSYRDAAWQRATGDGVASRLDRAVRSDLDSGYSVVRILNDLNAQNTAAESRLLTLSRPLPLDADVRVSLLQEMDELRGRVIFMSLIQSQMLGSWRAAGMTRPVREARTFVAGSGTRRFCATQGLPLRTVEAAARPET